MRAVLLPARYDPMKDHATFLDAAEKLAIRHPDVFFVLAGKDVVPENGALAAGIAARGMGARIRLLGERNDLDELYPAFDLVTLASAYGEGFPNVLGEAMACGIPCVATDTGDSAEIIGDTGIIVQPRNPEALAAAWSQVLSLRHGEREALGARARARIVTNYNLDDILARYQAFYQEIGTETR
jgi:glycosyltransferase involved in cell wall biosynthesis